MVKKICGTCSHFYCEHCVKKEESANALTSACSFYTNFNRYEYVSNVKSLKGVI